MSEKVLFTSESVSEGHPDKIADQISDAVLDAALSQDPLSRVACEVFTTTNTVIVGGEITTKAELDIEKIARNTLIGIGYTDDKFGIDGHNCNVQVLVHTQSPDIAMGVDSSSDTKEVGAGDQGIMFGFATNETENYMPLAIEMAHMLVKRATELRKNGQFKWARPDMKSQVTIDYTDSMQPKIDTVLMSIQHDDDFDQVAFIDYVTENVIKAVAKQFGMNEDFRILINPTGRFVVGGPHGDAGLTGRKIIVDTYGGAARHGGGAFSGKDCTKVDRSAAYAARYVAKNIVAAGLADKCEIQLSYAIGVSEPISIALETFGTEKVAKQEILKAIRQLFDLTPNGIINMLNLRKPQYQQVAAYGHFGRSDVNVTWEKTDKVSELEQLLTVAMGQ
ncbi:S-adenosylmethionine synthase [Lysinibacillus sphaericus]|uniref:methionine adenosyltransferase n=1 Tax=Lysinibacillus sphaericus TaxID=1421 RepID=UPI0018CF5584|nr:methionine adenosyltransferase [Lysinibacillus sphaericus]MBG9453721.1 S-adenosylmethionine synthase [Lysinibacillus sphaericus]MBG9476192.1 S-adenosylmethionine synthase [Lysinibacillus sphaericus]MBG9591606.1 S-adenosylmethionine synthase [Lysinibacillus sphaericus]